MKSEYDFSGAERGKFYRKGAEIRLPIYLESSVQRKIESIARKKDKEVGEIVNEVLKSEISLLEELT